MKKLILLCLVFVYSTTFYAQTATEKKAKAKTEQSTKKAKKDVKEKESKKEKATKLKKDGTPDKRFKEEDKAPLKKDGTLQKLKQQQLEKQNQAKEKQSQT